MKLITRWKATRFGIFQRRTEHELYCRVELSEREQAAYLGSGVADELVCEYRSRGLPMDTRLSSLVAGETRFGSEDKAYLEDIEKNVSSSIDRLTAKLQEFMASNEASE